MPLASSGAPPPSKSAEALVATTVRTIFQQPSAEAVHAQHARVVEQLDDRFPEATAMLDEAAAEVLAFTACPVAHWKQVWSNNPQERLNREIRRRTDVVGIFPNRAAVVRLVGAVLAEQNDEWAVARRYMTMVTLLPSPGREVTSTRGSRPRPVPRPRGRGQSPLPPVFTASGANACEVAAATQQRRRRGVVRAHHAYGSPSDSRRPTQASNRGHSSRMFASPISSATSGP